LEINAVDKHFLEFWGNVLINAAKEQKRMEDLSKWMQQGFKGFDDFTEMFKKFYGLEHMEKDTPASMDIWEKASENFLNSFKDYLNLMGMVSKEEHLTLIKKYEKLKEKAAAQEELVQGFHDLIEKQSNQFQKTMETFGSLFKKENNR
jgi:hypothetical protein